MRVCVCQPPFHRRGSATLSISAGDLISVGFDYYVPQMASRFRGGRAEALLTFCIGEERKIDGNGRGVCTVHE